MYSNARLSKPSTTHRRHPRPATSSRDDFQVGTLRPSYSTFAPNSPLPRHQLASQRLAHSSMKAASLPHTPEIFQLNPALVPFSSLHQSRHAPPSSDTPYTPTPHEHRNQPQAGTVLELAKQKPIAEHVGATHHQYPATVVGDTLLRQQALLTINSLPTLISRLKEDLADMAGMANPRPPPPQPRLKQEVDEQSLPSGSLDDTAVADEIRGYERLLKEIGRVQLRIGTTQDPLADKDLLALKRLEVISEQTASITQAAAAKLATEAIDAIKTQIASLKAPAKPKATYSAAAAGKQK